VEGQADTVDVQAEAPRAFPGPLVVPPTLSRIVYRRLLVTM
jgi:hypothetical protein